MAIGCSVEEMLEKVSSAEITMWIAYFEIEREEQKRAAKK